MIVFITGVAGFIGSNVARRLIDSGHKVIGIDNFDPFYDISIKKSNLERLLNSASFTFYEADIRDQEKLLDINEKVDVVIHLAAKAGVLPSIREPQEYIEVNIKGTYNVLEMMRKKGVTKLVFASSSSVYGNNSMVPFSEDHKVDNPISPYAFTKKSCELLNHNYHHLYNFDILNLRFFTVYGPGQRPDLAIHKFIKLIDADKPIELYGDGSTARDYTYIDDIVNGVERSMDYVMNHQKVFKILNIGNNSPVTLRELVDHLYVLMKKKPAIHFLPKQPGDVDITYADISRATQLVGYRPAITIEEGLKRFIEWYKAKNS